MKIAITFKGTMIEDYKIALKKRNFNVGDSSFKNVLWVYDLRYVYTNYNNELVIENKKIESYTIDLEDIEYYEIYSN